MKHRSIFWLLGLIVLAGVMVLVSMNGLVPALKAVLFGLLTLILPGFVLTVVLFRGRSLWPPEQLLLSIGLGLSLAGLTFLCLNAIRHQSRAMPLVVGLILAGSGLLAITILVTRYPDVLKLPARNLASFSRYRLGLLGLAALVSLLALNLAQTPASPDGLAGYTLLWVEPAESPDWLVLGVRSEEFAPTSYRLEIDTGGSTTSGPTLELQPGETREFSLEISGEPLKEKPVTIRLYRLDQPDQIYRRVVWWHGANASRKTSQ